MTASQTGAVVCAVWLVLIGVTVCIGRALADLRASRSADLDHDPCPLCRLEDYR